jgi:amino acid permease
MLWRCNIILNRRRSSFTGNSEGLKSADLVCDNSYIRITIGLAVITPLAFLRRLDSLRYVSFLAIAAIVYIVGLVFFYALLWPEGMPKEGLVSIDQIVWWNPDPMSLARYSPIFVFAFTCHPNLFSIHNELKSNTNKRMSIIIFITIVITYEFAHLLTR